MNYDQFRTGLTFRDVSRMLYDEAMARKYKNDGTPPLFVRRKTVLGRWHQLKQEMWAYYCATERSGSVTDSRESEQGVTT